MKNSVGGNIKYIPCKFINQLFVAILFFFAAAFSVSAARLEYMGNCTIDLTGEIDKFTADDLKETYEISNMKCSSPVLNLNSNGGDIDVAMKVGEWIRDKGLSTQVWINNSCASACVLLFLGGVDRTIFEGRIGLHTPYTDKYALSTSDADSAYENINQRIRQYLSRMNIPESILNNMNAVPPGDIRWFLCNDDLRQLVDMHVIGQDPVWQDQKDSARAQKLGISKREYYTPV